MSVQLVSKIANQPLPGAAVWDYSDAGNPKFIGGTDCEGVFRSADDVGMLRLRFFAYGFAPVDYNETGISNGMATAHRIHPGAYSGFLAGSASAIWKEKTGDKHIQFTAFGYYRRADSLREMFQSSFEQFTLNENFSLVPPGPISTPLPSPGPYDVGDKPKGDPRTGWSLLHMRSDVFPTGLWTTKPLDPDMHFRFPAPAKMLMLKDPTGTASDEYELVN